MGDWTEVIDLSALADWMSQQDLEQGPISDAAPLGGGTQNILLHFRRGGREFVLRRPPLHPRRDSNDTMRREMRMLAALADTNVPHPPLIAACPEQDVLGTAFYLMEPVTGFNPTEGLPEYHASYAAVRRHMGLALVDGITALGAVDYRATGLTDLGRPDEYLQRQVTRWRRQLESYGEFPGWPGPGTLPGVDRIGRWLDDNRPAHFEPGIIHGDYHLGNVLFRRDGPELAAIVDWELTTIGDPLIDLGWLLATWPEDGHPIIDSLEVTPWHGFPEPHELIERYRKGSRRDLASIDWYAVLACYKLGIILEGTHARACAGLAPRQTGDMLHRSTISLLERGLGWIDRPGPQVRA